MHPREIVEAVLESIALVRRLRFSHMLVGALAVALWGEPRATKDADLMIQLPEGAWERVRRHARQVGFEIDTVWERYNPMLRDQHLRLIKNRIRVDLMGPRDAHDGRALERRRFKIFAGRRISVIAPDDLVLHKLKTGRPRDFDDVTGVLRRSAALMDLEYLWSWAKRLRVTEELEYLLTHASGKG